MVQMWVGVDHIIEGQRLPGKKVWGYHLLSYIGIALKETASVNKYPSPSGGFEEKRVIIIIYQFRSV